ncbi:hypothetical protein HK405_011720 [Cladochytrium tenue]|nr:hypothetical protein HK405_011720 [Cladochytrium tenue]
MQPFNDASIIIMDKASLTPQSSRQSSELDLPSSLPVAVGDRTHTRKRCKRPASTDRLNLTPDPKRAIKEAIPAARAPTMRHSFSSRNAVSNLGIEPAAVNPTSPEVLPPPPTSPSGRAQEGVTCPHPGCDVVIRDSKNMDEHLRTHDPTREKFPCELCGKRMTRQRDVRRHMLSHEQGGRFRCGWCGADLRRKDNLRKHRESACRPTLQDANYILELADN